MSQPVTLSTRGILFDMDGVLISSIGSVNRCWHRWAMQYGIPNAESFAVPHGRRAIEIVTMMRPDIDPKEGLRTIEDMEMEDMADLRVLPGVKELLEALPPDRWTIVTSATRRLLLGRLEAAGLPVPARLVSGDMVERGKPDPEPYQRGAALLGFSPSDCLVIEDAPSGVGSGRAAGCRVLGILGSHQAEELTYATWVLPSLEDLAVESTGDGLLLHLPSTAVPGSDASLEIISDDSPTPSLNLA